MKVLLILWLLTTFLFSNELYSLKHVDKYGYVNQKGKWAIEPNFEKADQFEGEFASVVINSKKGVIDKTGKFILEPIYDYIVQEADYFIVGKNNKYGWFDKSGKKIFDIQYDWIYPFNKNGQAWVKIDGKYGLMDRSGNLILKPIFSYDYADPDFKEDRLEVLNLDGKKTFVNIDGDILTKPKFDKVIKYINEDSYVIVELNKKL